MSDWDARPLTTVQEVYAALDAHSLLGLFVIMTGERDLLTYYQDTILNDDSTQDILYLDSSIWRQYLSR